MSRDNVIDGSEMFAFRRYMADCRRRYDGLSAKHPEFKTTPEHAMFVAERIWYMTRSGAITSRFVESYRK